MEIFGLAIRRTTDLIGEQGREAFWRIGIELDAKLISIVVALYESGGLSSSELTRDTGLMRQLVESRLKKLERGGYVTSEISPVDGRKRVFSLSPERHEDVERAVQTMRDFESVYDELWTEIGVDLGEAMVKLERALRAQPLIARLCNKHSEYVEQVRVRREA